MSLLVLIILGAGSAFFAYRRFAHLDPRSDQATNAEMSKELAEAKHLFPLRHAGEPFRNNLEADRTAWLHVPGEIYASFTIVCLDATNILTNWLAMLVLPHTYATTILTSILISSLTPCLVCLWIFTLFPDLSPVRRAIAALFGGLLLLLCAYRFYFSAWGAHNFAVFFFTAACVAISNLIVRIEAGLPVRRYLILSVLLSACALYSYSTNFLLLCLGLPASLLLMRALPRQRVVWAAGAVALCVALTYPVLGLHPEVPAGEATRHTLGDAWLHARNWFTTACTYYPVAGLVLGAAGIVLPALKKNIYLLLVFTLVHFTLWTLLLSFTWNGTPTSVRTFNYLLPLLAAGGGSAVAFALQLRSGVARTFAIAAILVIAIAQFASQLSLIQKEGSFAAHAPLFADTYFYRQGEMQRWASGTLALIPEDATIIPGDAEISVALALLSTPRAVLDHEAPTTEALLRHLDGQDLDYYLEHRRRFAPNCSSVYLIEDTSETKNLQRLLSEYHYRCRFTDATPLAQYDLPRDNAAARPVTLYRLTGAPLNGDGKQR